MAKRTGKKGPPPSEAPPPFAGFKPLAGLKELKDRLAAEKAKEEAAAKKPVAGAPTKPATQPKPQPKATTTYGSSRASTTADDELAFHRMMSGVTPLGEGSGRVGVTTQPQRDKTAARPAEVREKARQEAVQAIEHLHQLVDEGARFEVTDDGKRVEGRLIDTPASLVRSLRQGLLSIDGRLDLHGLGAGEAQERLATFLQQMRARGERCVLIIHGKGEGGPERGVLRGEIAAWLSQGRARTHVAAFTTARDKDGGEGALYVALRR